MDIYFKNEEMTELTEAAKYIMRLLARAQGRADSYAARREDFKII